MTKRTLCLFFIMAGSFSIVHSQVEAFNSINSEYSLTRSSKIHLAGHLSTPTNRSISQPIVVSLNNRCLDSYFLLDLGKITISIINDQGLSVFNETVLVSVGTRSFIDLSNFPEGVYEIKFRNTEGEELFGFLNI